LTQLSAGFQPQERVLNIIASLYASEWRAILKIDGSTIEEDVQNLTPTP
jgi:hypothetical protein